MRELKNIFRTITPLLGPLCLVIILALPTGLPREQHNFLAIFAMVVALWLFSEVPLFVSGLIGVTLSVLFGVVSVKEAFAPFADPIIFLFLGGFLLARSLELTGLDQRLAQRVLSHPWSNQSPKRVILSFYLLAFVLSMWISNTAAMALLLPVSYGVIKKLEDQFQFKDEALTEKLILGLAYCTTIGGNVTPIGSPPNVVAIGLLRELKGISVGFLQWMMIAAPIALILFACVYFITINSMGLRDGKSEFHRPQLAKISSIQRWVMGVFFLTVTLWIAPSFLQLFVGASSGFGKFLSNALAPSIVAIGCTSLLFLAPLHSPKKILSTADMASLDWGSLLLFGSGLSLGKILFESGLASIFASMLEGVAPYMGFGLLLSLILLATIFATELASNTATSNILIPVVLALQSMLGNNSIMPAIFIALACNSAFMLPVATPPNAIAYGSGKINKNTMIKEGFALNMASWLVLSLLIFLFT